MSTLEYLDSAGTVNFRLVHWEALNEWLSSLNGNTHIKAVLPNGVNRGKVVQELEDRHKKKKGAFVEPVVTFVAGGSRGHGNSWTEYENKLGYTHLEELLIYQPTDWRKQAREYILRYNWDIVRHSASTDKRRVDLKLEDGNDDEFDVSIQLPSPVHVVLFHPEMSRTSRYEALFFVLSWGAKSPLDDVKNDITVRWNNEQATDDDSIDVNGIFASLLADLSPLDYFFRFQESVDLYRIDKLKEIAIKSKLPRLLLMREFDFSNIVGQRMAKDIIRQEVITYIRSRDDAGPFATKRQPLSMIFAGPSGNGKTELAEWLATLLNKPDEDAFLKIDCGQMTRGAELFGLAGAYQGAEEGSTLNNFILHISDSPGSVGVVLLDEIEKADREVIHGLYQVLDKAEWTNKKLSRQKGGQTNAIPCHDIIFIMTTNAADTEITELAGRRGVFTATGEEFEDLKASFESRIRKKLQNVDPFTKAFMGRVGSVVPFLPMSNGNCDEQDECLLAAETTVIAKYLIEREQECLTVNQVMKPATKAKIARIVVTDAVEEAGVRGIQKLVRDHMSKRVMHALLKEKGGIEENCTVAFSADVESRKTEFRIQEFGETAESTEEPNTPLNDDNLFG
jgi:DNA polymerase III delta prime subunit